RLAHAHREIALQSGEMPVQYGYSASTFKFILNLIEGCGRSSNGSITAFFTSLLSEDFEQDPINDVLRSVTDGHIHLSKEISQISIYPAIDLQKSVSRFVCESGDSIEAKEIKEFIIKSLNAVKASGYFKQSSKEQ